MSAFRAAFRIPVSSRDRGDASKRSSDMKKSYWLALPALMLVAAQAHADARGDVIAAYDKAFAKGRSIATVTGDSRGKQQRTTVRVQLPDSFHIIVDANETIVLPGATYMKMG